MPISQVFNTNCVEYMRTLPDNHFKLSIADPPYGGATIKVATEEAGSEDCSTNTKLTDAEEVGQANTERK